MDKQHDNTETLKRNDPGQLLYGFAARAMEIYSVADLLAQNIESADGPSGLLNDRQRGAGVKRRAVRPCRKDQARGRKLAAKREIIDRNIAAAASTAEMDLSDRVSELQIQLEQIAGIASITAEIPTM